MLSSTRLARSLALALTLAFASVLSVSTAHAEHRIGTPYSGTRPFQLDIYGGFTWHGYGFAGGARFGFPIVNNPIPSIDNALYLNFGFDFYFTRVRGCGGVVGCAGDEYAPGFGIPVSVHWEFYFSDMWSAFAELGVNIYVPPGVFRYNDWYWGDNASAWVLAQVGGRLHFSEAFALTVRVGNPYASFGIEFEF